METKQGPHEETTKQPPIQLQLVILSSFPSMHQFALPCSQVEAPAALLALLGVVVLGSSAPANTAPPPLLTVI
jgi:hypothetical protein